MAPTCLLLLLWWLQDVTSGYSSVESLYTWVRYREGDTLSVNCSYNHRKNRVENKMWCKVRKRKCEPGFVRKWVQGPSYLLEDDIQAKVVTITMRNLRHQDSGRYWCMRNTQGTLYPITGFMLEVFPASTTERDPLLTHPANVLSSEFVILSQGSTSDSEAPSTTGLLTLSPTALETSRPTPVTDDSATAPGLSWTTESPSDATASSAGPTPTSTSTKSRHVNSGSPVTGICHNHLPSLRLWVMKRDRKGKEANKSPLKPATPVFSKTLTPLDGLGSSRPPTVGPGSQESSTSPVRHWPREPYLTVLVVVLTLLPAPVMFAMVYRFWRKRHMGSYRMSRDGTRSWLHPCRAPEPLWKFA